MNIVRSIPKFVLMAFVAVSTTAGVLAIQATHPAVPGATSASFVSEGALPASAQGYPYHRPGYYHARGRYWAHRRWQRGYYGPHHRWHPGVWVYF